MGKISFKTLIIGIVITGLIVSALYLGAEKLDKTFFDEKNRDYEVLHEEDEQDSGQILPTQGGWALVKRQDEVNLLTRVIAGEATGEPYEGQVAVGAVLLNRVRNASFPNTISGVIYQPHAFESVTNGLIWRVADLATARRAAMDALNGWDPTYGSLFFWNPYKPVSRWIWTRKIVRQIGTHVFGI